MNRKSSRLELYSHSHKYLCMPSFINTWADVIVPRLFPVEAEPFNQTMSYCHTVEHYDVSCAENAAVGYTYHFFRQRKGEGQLSLVPLQGPGSLDLLSFVVKACPKLPAAARSTAALPCGFHCLYLEPMQATDTGTLPIKWHCG